MDATRLKPGDRVIYRKQKSSTSPGERAIEVRPASSGETYQYMVDKFWIVDEVLEDNQIRLRTRRGKIHIVPADDLRMRTPRWWERWLYRSRFESIELANQASESSPKPASESSIRESSTNKSHEND